MDIIFPSPPLKLKLPDRPIFQQACICLIWGLINNQSRIAIQINVKQVKFMVLFARWLIQMGDLNHVVYTIML